MRMPVPMGFRSIADDIKERVRTGEYKPGEKLPTYGELAALYSVSITTMQRAVGLLVERGVIVTSPGRGIYVADEPRV